MSPKGPHLTGVVSRMAIISQVTVLLVDRTWGQILSHRVHALEGDWGIQPLPHPVFLLPGHELSGFATPQAPAKMCRLVPALKQQRQLIVDWISRSVLTCPLYKLLS